MSRSPFGFALPLPADPPLPLTVGVALWRGLVFALPLALLLAGLWGVEAGRAMQAEAAAIPWFVHFFTLGILWFMFAVMGALVAAAAVLVAVMALPLGVLLDRQLHRLLAQDGRTARPGLVMGLATVAGAFAYLAVSWRVGPGAHLLWITPLVVGILVTREESRRALRPAKARHEAAPFSVPVARSAHVVTPPVEEVRSRYACPQCGNVFLVRLSPTSGTPCPACRDAEPSVTPGKP